MINPRKLLQDAPHPHRHRHHHHHHHRIHPPPPPPSESKGVPGFEPNNPFESSLGTIAMILLSAFFFMGFFSLYIRKCTKSSSPDADPAPAATNSTLPQPSPVDKPPQAFSTVASLPLVSYGGESKDCVICLNEIHDGETVRVIPCCGHVFHPGCVDTWLVAHVSCPLCRSTNVFGVQEEESGATGAVEDLGNQIDPERESTAEN